jgi:hypothetical protein
MPEINERQYAQTHQKNLDLPSCNSKKNTASEDGK